ncbi:MAG TPA: hypothetical protein VGI40_26310 [Pirellulaceae bacterium]|jgi:hypothetical protein
MTTDNSNDLDWLAFSYAAGELNPTEAEQFELRLADDQTAREALARAVELCQVVAAAEIQSSNYVVPAAKTHTTWNGRLSWMAVGGLASLLLAMLWSGVIGPTWHTAQLRSFSKQNLAFAWTETNHEIANVREVSFLPAGLTDTDDYNTSAVAFDVSADEAPTWMTAALLSSSPAESSNTDLNSPDSNS